LSGGRLGDNLLSYLHAKWLAFKYNIPVIYKSFKYSDQLQLSIIEKKYNNKDFEKIIILKKELINSKKNILYLVPYFSEDKTEFQYNPDWPYFQVDWDNKLFKEEIKKAIFPIKSFKFDIPIPKDRISVAVHVRLGGGVDDRLLKSPKDYNSTKNYANLNFPLKFPPLDFYVEQIKKISLLLDHKNLYVYIFTDDYNPRRILKKIKKQLSCYNNIIFDCRKKYINPKKCVLQDFFAFTHFDCLIRSQSNYSLVASKISDFKIEIFPVNYRIENHFPIISEVEIIRKGEITNDKIQIIA